MTTVFSLLFGREDCELHSSRSHYNYIILEYPGGLKIQFYILSVMLFRAPALYNINTAANETAFEFMGAPGIQDACEHIQYPNKSLIFYFSAIAS